MGSWIIWLIIAAVLGTVEIATTTLAFGLLGAAALIAAGAGFLGGDAAVQFGAFVLASGSGSAWPARSPCATSGSRRCCARAPPRWSAGPAIVLEEVGPHSGRVRIGGEEWSARSYDETQVIPAGSTVDVMHIEGATALVYPRE